MTTGYLVEIVRYGTELLGVQNFGVFVDKSKEEIKKIMRNYNEIRGGKYPVYYITEVIINPNHDLLPSPKEKVDLRIE